MRAAALGLALALAAGLAGAAEPWEERAPGSVRVATLNAALGRPGAGLLLREMEKGSAQIDAIAEIVLRVRPDILLVTKFDRDPEGRALAAFAGRLRAGIGGVAGLDYPHLYQGPVNAGVPSGHDLDGDGKRRGPGDAHGYGRFPGQFAMALLSRFPVQREAARTFNAFRWAALPGADRPVAPGGEPHHADAVWEDLRLSSVGHWDVPVTLPSGARLHVLAAHATPPTFDGPEDRNGRRNADEIRLLTGLIEGAAWVVDDGGRAGGLAADAAFVFAGDLNADPHDGEARREAIRGLLAHPRVQDPAPASVGGAEAAAQGGANADHAGLAALDTADWRDRGGPGNMRVDYVLPSAGLEVTGAGVFWPPEGHPLARLVAGDGREPASSNHRLVWVDILPPGN